MGLFNFWNSLNPQEEPVKRSEINQIIQEADTFMKAHGFHLPPFAYWTPQEWGRKGPEVREIVANSLGWDITDFGSGEYTKYGLFLFTLRNGNPKNLRPGQDKTYAEKILLVEVDQITPMHFHWRKMEDIINRGGGKLAIKLYNSSEDEQLAQSNITVTKDGVVHQLKAGETVVLEVGESITLPTGLYHEFWGVDSKVLVGEVSSINDDATDNRFLKPGGRFPDIEEDVPPLHLLVGDYAKYYRG
jgi:D-lyxose ketol-isomerase